MTLILTALFKNGICVCADRRYKIIDSNGAVKFEDNHNKIYKFDKTPLIIFNHGINRLKNKDWKIFCSDYEKSGRWNDKNLFQIVNDFKDFIENDVIKELNIRKNDTKYAVGFLLCGKTSLDSKFKINELFWSVDSNGIKFEIRRHRGFARAGDAKKCLDVFLKHHPEYNTENYWKRLDLIRAEKELKKLFSIAVEEKRQLNEDGFSDSFDIGCVTE